MGSIVAELAEKISSATNNFSVDAQVLYVDTVNDEVGVNTTTPDGAFSIHQSGTDDIFNLYDGTDNITTVVDGGALTHKGSLTVGVDDAGHDVKFFGATSGAYMLWDESADDLILAGASGLSLSGTGSLTVASGNVGIGTTSPDAPLDIEASHSYNADASNHANGLRLTNASTGNMSIEWWHSTGSGTEFASIVGQTDDAGSNTYDDGNIVFRTKYDGTMADKMLIQSDGNVGIGVTSPNAKLQVGDSCKVNTSLGVGTDASGITGEIRATNNVTAYYSSDITLKENISPIGNALDKLSQISGVEFDWTKDYIDDHGGEDGYFVRKHDVGVIAQEIKKVLPEVVAERQDGTLAVRYEKIIALLIEAVKELRGKLGEK